MAQENDGRRQPHRTSGVRISVREPQWRGRLARALPFYYGWVVFAVCASVSYSSRPVMAVATLSVFLVPMTEEFGWSRGMFAGAVSLGGMCAVAISPIAGWWIDRYGSALVVALGGLVTGACAAALSIVAQPWRSMPCTCPVEWRLPARWSSVPPRHSATGLSGGGPSYSGC